MLMIWVCYVNSNAAYQIRMNGFQDVGVLCLKYAEDTNIGAVDLDPTPTSPITLRIRVFDDS